MDSFLNQNHGEGWMLPEALRLEDYGLGHDARAKTKQPVAARFGPRFLQWQLAGSTEDPRVEEYLHARNRRGADGYADLVLGLLSGAVATGRPLGSITERLGDHRPDGDDYLRAFSRLGKHRIGHSPLRVAVDHLHRRGDIDEDHHARLGDSLRNTGREDHPGNFPPGGPHAERPDTPQQVPEVARGLLTQSRETRQSRLLD